MGSRESDFAWRAARYYEAKNIVHKSRSERIAFVRTIIALLESKAEQEHAAHKAICPKCGSGDFCLSRFSVTPADRERSDKLRFLRALIHSEEQDEAYAQRARVHPVKYKQHVDGFCSYWQNVRHRKFVAVGWQCECCGSNGNGSLDAHHLHYDTLGFEELCDLQALCRKCHKHADEVRATVARYSNAMSTYMEKKYGGDWPVDAEEEFDEWFERKQEQEW